MFGFNIVIKTSIFTTTVTKIEKNAMIRENRFNQCSLPAWIPIICKCKNGNSFWEKWKRKRFLEKKHCRSIKIILKIIVNLNFITCQHFFTLQFIQHITIAFITLESAFLIRHGCMYYWVFMLKLIDIPIIWNIKPFVALIKKL